MPRFLACPRSLNPSAMLSGLLKKHPGSVSDSDSAVVRKIDLALTKLQVSFEYEERADTEHTDYGSRAFRDCFQAFKSGTIEEECKFLALLLRLKKVLGSEEAIRGVHTFIAEAMLGTDSGGLDLKGWIEERYRVDLEAEINNVTTLRTSRQSDVLHLYACFFPVSKDSEESPPLDLSSFVPTRRNWTLSPSGQGASPVADALSWIYVYHLRGTGAKRYRLRQRMGNAYEWHQRELEDLVVSVWMEAIKDHVGTGTVEEARTLAVARGRACSGPTGTTTRPSTSAAPGTRAMRGRRRTWAARSAPTAAGS